MSPNRFSLGWASAPANQNGTPMSTVKLTADMSGEFVQIIADEVDGMRRDVFTTEIESTFTFALFHVHREMYSVAADLGGRIDDERLEMSGVRYVLGAV